MDRKVSTQDLARPRRGLSERAITRRNKESNGREDAEAHGTAGSVQRTGPRRHDKRTVLPYSGGDKSGRASAERKGVGGWDRKSARVPTRATKRKTRVCKRSSPQEERARMCVRKQGSGGWAYKRWPRTCVDSRACFMLVVDMGSRDSSNRIAGRSARCTQALIRPPAEKFSALSHNTSCITCKS